jgi:hypothetical protein
MDPSAPTLDKTPCALCPWNYRQPCVALWPLRRVDRLDKVRISMLCGTRRKSEWWQPPVSF